MSADARAGASPGLPSGRAPAGDECDSIFVVADDNDTVKDLYRRLGFNDVGRRWSFWWPRVW